LVIYLNRTMMQGLTNLKIRLFLRQSGNDNYDSGGCVAMIINMTITTNI